MTQQKKTVETYMAGFRTTNHELILSCLTEDVIWEMPGYFYHEGKTAFDGEIENPHAEGHPEIVIYRMIEAGDIVVAEGSVQARMKDGSLLDAVFCDVFHFTGGKISKLTTYLMFRKPH